MDRGNILEAYVQQASRLVLIFPAPANCGYTSPIQVYGWSRPIPYSIALSVPSQKPLRSIYSGWRVPSQIYSAEHCWDVSSSPPLYETCNV